MRCGWCACHVVVLQWIYTDPDVGGDMLRIIIIPYVVYWPLYRNGKIL